MLGWDKVRIITKAYLLQPALDLVHEAFTTILIVPSGYLSSNLVPILDFAIVSFISGTQSARYGRRGPALIPRTNLLTGDLHLHATRRLLLLTTTLLP